MSDDIRLSLSFRECRKKKKLHRKLGADGVLGLIELWIGVAASKPSGVLSGWDADDIALEGNYSGDADVFVSTLVSIGLLDKEDGVYSVHNWGKNQPWVIGSESRSILGKRKGILRWCLEGIPDAKEKDLFREWFNNDAVVDANSSTLSIQTAYRRHTDGNAPFLTLPIPSKELPEQLANDTTTREGEDWPCTECGVMNPDLMGCCLECESVR